jgi:hypothetical protein
MPSLRLSRRIVFVVNLDVNFTQCRCKDLNSTRSSTLTYRLTCCTSEAVSTTCERSGPELHRLRLTLHILRVYMGKPT